jgi:WD40 repeat protein
MVGGGGESHYPPTHIRPSPPPPPLADPVTGRALPPPRRIRARLPDQPCIIPGSIVGTLPTARQGTTSLSISPDGALIAVACIADQSYPVRVFEVYRGREVAHLEGHGNLVYQVTWSPKPVEGQYLLTASGDGTAALWHLPRSGPRWHRLRGPARMVSRLSHVPPAYVYCARFHPSDPSVVITGSYDHSLRLWDTRVAEANNTGVRAGAGAGAGAGTGATGLAVLEAACLGFIGGDPSSSGLARGGGELALSSTFRSGDGAGGGGRAHPHAGHVNCVEFDNLGDPAGVARRMITADSLGTILVWELSAKGKPGSVASYSLLRELRPSAFKNIPIVSLRVRPGFAHLLVLGQANVLRLFDLNTYSAIRAYPNARCSASRLEAVFSPDGRFIAAGSEDGQLCLWDADTGSVIPARAVADDGQRVAIGYPALLLAVGWSPSSHMIAVGAFGLEYPVMLCT